MRFRHNVVVQNDDVGGDVVRQYTLGVNPLSVLLLCIRPLNDTGTLSEFKSYLSLLSAVTRVNLMVLGESIINGSAADLAALAYFRHGVIYPQAMHLDTDNFRRCAVLPLFLGRSAYDPESCLPAFNRGDLTLELTLDDAAAGWDDLQLTIESIELPDAKPKAFERKLTTNATFPGVSRNSIDLQTGHLCRGLLLYGTTGFTGATPAPSFGRITTSVDGAESGYHSTDFEVAHGLSSLWGRQPPGMDNHQHRVTTDGNAQTGLSTSASTPFGVGSGWTNYAFLDYDVMRDDSYSLDLRSARRFELLSDSETANAVRIIQVESIDAKKMG